MLYIKTPSRPLIFFGFVIAFVVAVGAMVGIFSNEDLSPPLVFGQGMDVTGPAVSIVAPQPGLSVFGPQVFLSANATDDVGVVGVQFKSNGVNIGSEVPAPFNMNWDTTGLSGSKSITAVARDAAGNMTTSAPVSVTISSSGATYLSAGGGFGGNTAIPSPVGDSGAAGYAAKAIARWDVVPFQTFPDTINVGVVAFHINGISKVSFSANGGAWTDVTDMSINPETNVAEYWTTLDASDFSDGLVEVRAIVYPVVGTTRVLQDASGTDVGDKSLMLYANSNGLLANTGEFLYVSEADGSDTTGAGTSGNPFQSIAKALATFNGAVGSCDGGTIYFKAGTYVYPDTGSYPGLGGNCASVRWLTLENAPGTAESDVVFIPPTVAQGGILEGKIHVKNVTLFNETNDIIFAERSSPYGNMIWLDSVQRYGTGFDMAPVTTASPTSFEIIWETGTQIHDTDSALGDSHIVARNVSAYNIGGDFSNSKRLSANISVDHMRFTGGVHPDVVQVPIGAIENMIIFGLRATDVAAQGLNIGDGGQPMSNVAVVNALLEKVPGDFQNSFSGGGITTDHYLLWHITHINYEWRFDGRSGHTNLSIRNNVMLATPELELSEFVNPVVDNNHFILPTTARGTNYTSGDPLYIDEDAKDYRPADGSPLLNRITGLNRVVTFDLAGKPVYVGGAIGALQTPSTLPDTTAPGISSVSASVSQTGATVTWTTNEVADSQVEYGSSASYGSETNLDSTLTTSHSVSISGLSADHTYHYRVTSSDADQNSSTSGDFTFTTDRSSSTGGSRGGGGGSRGGGGSSGGNSTTTPPYVPPFVPGDTQPTRIPVFTRDLSFGMSGSDISTLQRILISLGFLQPGATGGNFQTLTRAALMAYQQSQGILPASGLFGPLTRAAIERSAPSLAFTIVPGTAPGGLPGISSPPNASLSELLVQLLQQLVVLLQRQRELQR